MRFNRDLAKIDFQICTSLWLANGYIQSDFLEIIEVFIGISSS